jgi:DNA-binding SARP family transcriptional activator/TolB-like protein
MTEAAVMPDDLRAVYEVARSQTGDAIWPRLSAHEQTVAVYQQIRALDGLRMQRYGQPLTRPLEMVSSATTDPTIIRLRLIGQMEAWTVTGENILPTGRKTRALLAAVALSAPRPVLRARLSELLWSRRPDEQARASLRQEIQLLLKALARAKAEILRVTRDTLGLVPGAVWIDAEQVMNSSVCREAALALQDGELLEDLDGVDPAFDMWLAAERERLRDRARGMAESLMRDQTEPNGIIAAADRLLQIDRACEEAWRAIIRAHAERGERGMAIQAFERCRAVLADLLDAEPSAETLALIGEIRGPSSRRLPARPPHAQEPNAEAGGDAGALVHGARDGGRGPARIGVLPLRCVGLPDDAAYLGPSVANEITTALSRFRWMSVVSSNSVSRLALDNRDMAAIRRSKAVDFLLDGAIQRSRGNLRVTLRLLDLRQDNQVVWARRFDRAADDPLAAQEEIAGEAAAQIEPVVLFTEARRIAARAEANDTTYELILRAAPLIARLDRTSFMRAGAYLARAVELAPDEAPAHAWHAVWHALLMMQGWDGALTDADARASALIERAIKLDPYSAGAFAVAGHIQGAVRGRPREALALFERALELNPHVAPAWAMSAINQVLLGRAEEAERRYQRYKVLAPLDPYSFMFDGMFSPIHLLRRDFHAGVAFGRTVTQLNPLYTAGYKPYLAALGHVGAVRDAAAVLHRLRAMEPGIGIQRCLRLFPLQRDEDREVFAEGLRRAGMT